ncbi:/ / hypothetical protein / 586887:588569 Forward [Candidatus Hepatoplasma crinochetorum]|uniref:KAP NTPase domain-containing protein n=1 Tax=Candidatus Hepatoplasma crinochetorum TaxID=295596 RepID=A0A0G7ZN80_9MOLU|nr:/ / hypothetical protein / 586887:588569 Forward [Candidatus Hepatoplasma crinochetorum]
MENFIVNKGYSISLIVKEDDAELINVGNEFISEINKEYLKYKNKLRQEMKEFERYRENNNVYFSQEKILKKSPLTILNAPWGSGKTHFIEKLAKNFIDQKINLKTFKNIIILDVWKYSNSKHIPDEIMAELFFILSKIYDKEDTKKLMQKLHRFAIKFFNATAISWINYFGKANFEKLQIKEINETEKIIDNISNDLEPTLIIFDNIERIGKSSWEILKAIFKISQIDNFCFILPMNLNKLNDNKKEKNDEYPIEKYIDLPIFEFEQNYLSFLKTNGIREEEAIIINNILNTEIDGKKLSIREVEQRFNKNDIFNIDNKYLKIDKIVKNVWGSVSEAKKYLDDEIKKFISQLTELEDKFNEIKIFIISNKNIKNRYIYNSNQVNENINNKIYIHEIFDNNWDYYQNYEEWINIFNDILDDIKIYIEEREKRKIVLISFQKKLNLRITQISQSLEKLSIEKENKNLLILKNKINLINQEIYNIEEEYKNLNYKFLEKIIIDYREKIKEINQNTNVYLVNKYYMWDRKFDYTKDNSNYIDYFVDCLFS